MIKILTYCGAVLLYLIIIRLWEKDTMKTKILIPASILLAASILNPSLAMESQEQTSANCLADKKQHVATQSFCFPSIDQLNCAYNDGIVAGEGRKQLTIKLEKTEIEFQCTFTYPGNDQIDTLFPLRDFKLKEIKFYHGMPFQPHSRDALENYLTNNYLKSASGLSGNSDPKLDYEMMNFSDLGNLSCRYLLDPQISITIDTHFLDKGGKRILHPLKYYSIEMFKTHEAQGCINTQYTGNLGIPLLYYTYAQDPEGPEVELNPEDVCFFFALK